MPTNAPSGPTATSRRSSSLPTQANTMSHPAAASRGVGALEPPFALSQSTAFDDVRL